jgi:hypothetical protein
MPNRYSKNLTATKDYVSSVTLVITGLDLEPEQVTKILEMPPTRSWKRGQEKVFRSGRTHVYPWGGWKLFQSDETMKMPLEKQLEYWASLLAPKTASLRQLRGMDCAAVLDCYLSISETASVPVSAELLEKIAGCGVEIELNCFASGDNSGNQ